MTKGISGTSCRPKKTAEDPKECNDLFKEESSIFEQPIRFDVVEILGKKIRVIKHAF